MDSGFLLGSRTCGGSCRGGAMMNAAELDGDAEFIVGKLEGANHFGGLFSIERVERGGKGKRNTERHALPKITTIRGEQNAVAGNVDGSGNLGEGVDFGICGANTDLR